MTGGGRKHSEKTVRVDEEFLAKVALAYLERFDTTASNLRRVLRERVTRAMAKAKRDANGESDGEPRRADAVQLDRWIEQLLERYQASGVVDDRRLAISVAASQRARGASRRMILQKLRSKGVSAALASEVVAQSDETSDEPDAELAAARAYVRKRRLGPYRSADEARLRRDKDIAALARRGFGLDVARIALEGDPDSEP